ncbi:MAG TPA: copper chaperone PCu(A)C [Microthrixaceae bacterium]|nr:copper chaperone PCu(A)C [Microthrixaceae bacterium]
MTNPNEQAVKSPVATPLRRLAVVFGAVALLSGLMAGCTSDSDGKAAGSTSTSTTAKTQPAITGAWARATTAGMNSAIYMSIKGGSSDDELLSAATVDELADTVEIHETVVTKADDNTDMSSADTTPQNESDKGEGDMKGAGDESGGMGGETHSPMKKMQRVDKIDIPAGETVELAPGGYHVMLTKLHTDLKVGDSVRVTLTFKNAGEVELTADVREM